MQNHSHFTVLWTGDGSPSLRGDSEPMHHLGGAYSETQYIYGEAIRRFKDQVNIREWNVLVVGLGLGYIELLSVAEALKNNKKINILTYEIENELISMFLSWIKGESENYIYDRMLFHFQKTYPEFNLKNELLKVYNNGDWVIRGALDQNNFPNKKFHIILFDAFSGKSTPDLWTESFLLDFLKISACEKNSVFSTYSCTGVLKRALSESGFNVEKRKGFFGKRNSTIAFKIDSSFK